MLRTLIAALAIAVAPVAVAPAFAEKPPVYTGVLSNVAVGGYDAVAYFRQGEPVRGTAQHKILHQGVEYRFANAANLAAFRENPNAYVPQYGGYCAWAVANGYTAPGDPNAWRIVDGRLYLNYNAEIQRRWETNIPNFIRQGDSNWPTVLQR